MRRVEEEGWRRAGGGIPAQARIARAARCRRLSRWSLLEARAAGRAGGTGVTEVLPRTQPQPQPLFSDSFVPVFGTAILANAFAHPCRARRVCLFARLASPRCYLIASAVVDFFQLAHTSLIHEYSSPSLCLLRSDLFLLCYRLPRKSPTSRTS